VTCDAVFTINKCKKRPV